MNYSKTLLFTVHTNPCLLLLLHFNVHNLQPQGNNDKVGKQRKTLYQSMSLLSWMSRTFRSQQLTIIQYKNDNKRCYNITRSRNQTYNLQHHCSLLLQLYSGDLAHFWPFHWPISLTDLNSIERNCPQRTREKPYYLTCKVTNVLPFTYCRI